MSKNKSNNLPVVLEDVKPDGYEKPKRRNAFVKDENYNKIDKNLPQQTKIGSNGVTYVEKDGISTLFQTSKPKAQYIYDNQIPDKDKRNVGGKDYVHSSSIVGLLDRKAQETTNPEKQALLQYGRDHLINISDSAQAQAIRRDRDHQINKKLRQLKDQRGVKHDEITGEPLKKGAAFHHHPPKELETDPESVVDPSKGMNVNPETHNEIHKDHIYTDDGIQKLKEKYKE